MRPEDVPDDVLTAFFAAECHHDEGSILVLDAYDASPNLQRMIARAALSAVYPLIRSAVIEECAGVAEQYGTDCGPANYEQYVEGKIIAAEAIAEAIRALKDTP